MVVVVVVVLGGRVLYRFGIRDGLLHTLQFEFDLAGQRNPQEVRAVQCWMYKCTMQYFVSL